VHIAILNEFAFSDEQLNKLKGLGKVTVFDDTVSECQAKRHLNGVDIAIVEGFKAPLNNRVLAQADSLKFLSLSSTAYHFIDLEFASRRGIIVANIPGFSTEAVAEHTIALMFAVIRRIPIGDREVRENGLVITASENDGRFLGFDIKGKTMGVLGLGSIGTRVAELGLALGMKVVAYNRTPRKIPNVMMLSLDEVLKISDIVSVNLALTHETEYIISQRELNLMKQSAVLINTAAAPHIDEQALSKALIEKRIFGAGLDLLTTEGAENPLFALDNIVLSPHAGWWTKEAQENLRAMIIANVESFIIGKPLNVVSK